MLIDSVIYLLVIVFSLVEVNSEQRVCINETIVTAKVLTTYSFSVRQIYGFTVRSRMEVRIRDRYITKTKLQNNTICCKGYSKQYVNIEASEHSCVPICNPECIDGYCIRPGECACNSGYTKLNDTCVPLCEDGCSHGTCVAPNTCRCDPGYALINHKCQPVCLETCINGICTSPGTCECLPGYQQSETDCVCCNDVICSVTRSRSCHCSPGWLLTKHKSESQKCVPECKYSCGNGTCVSPNKCDCFPGYIVNYLRQFGYDDGPVCVPICMYCKSICVAPNKCIEQTTSTSTYADTTRTTNPYLQFRTNGTYEYYNETENKTTTTSYFISSSTSTERVFSNISNSNVTLGDPKVSSWVQQHGMFILIPVIVIVTAGVIMLLVWRKGMIISFKRSKTYNVLDVSITRNESDSYENIQFLPSEKNAKK